MKSLLKRSCMSALGAFAITALTLSAAVATPSNYGWVPTSNVNLGSCSGTEQVATDVWAQTCIAQLPRDREFVQFQGYQVFTASGSSDHWVQTMSQDVSGTAYFTASKTVPVGGISSNMGACGTIKLTPGQSMTCKTEILQFSDSGVSKIVIGSKFQVAADGHERGTKYSPNLTIQR